MKKKHLVKREDGFTLVEIIAVLVILGILAAVAIPKYFDLQDEAKKKAVRAAMAEAVSRVNGRFGKQLLNGSAWSEITYDNTTLGTNLEDFSLSTSVSGDNITLTVSAKPGSPAYSNDVTVRSMTKVIPKPGKEGI